MVKCSQHSSQVATTLVQHDKLFSTAESCGIKLVKFKESGKSLE